MPFSLIISGVTGRVGRGLADLARDDDTLRIAGALASESSVNRPVCAGVDARINAAPTPPIDAVIDFSTDAGCRGAIRCAADLGVALVVGTTGLSAETRSMLEHAGAAIPVLVAANMSLGACLLSVLAVRTTQVLNDAYDVSISEAHRAGKRDRPSGTALRLAQAIRQAGGGIDDSGIASVRGGDTVGEHLVRFDGAGETIELLHRVTDRRVFAAGALRAARWLAGREPGLYGMEETLGL